MRPFLSIQDLEAPLSLLPAANLACKTRILCLRLKNARQTLAMAEAFLRFSPRLAVRIEKTDESWIFMDVASTARLFAKGSGKNLGPSERLSPEAELLKAAQELADSLGLDASFAISDTPSGAQAFAACRPGFICPPGEEREGLSSAPLIVLLQLEGLKAWPRKTAVSNMIAFFHEIGLREIGELSRFEIDSLRERWGETGEILWRRLRALDRPPVSPFVPLEPLYEYVHLDFPISLTSLLMHAMQKPFERLFARLEGRRLHAEKAVLELRCEYSGAVKKIELSPCAPSRKLDLFFTLLENRLQDVDLENPIRDFDVTITTRPEIEKQLDFFEPRESDSDRLESLLSLLRQCSARAGFFKPRESLLPEGAWTLEDSSDRPQPPAPRPALALRSRLAATQAEALQASAEASSKSADAAIAAAGRPSLSGAPGWGREPGEEYEDPKLSVRAMPEYSLDLMEAPRPTRLLQTPKKISKQEMKSIKVLAQRPIERIESGWWKNGPRRDYSFAVSSSGQCLWIFRDLDSGDWRLHGYFD